MADDWKPGDLALCVKEEDGGPPAPRGWLPAKGGVYNVVEVLPSERGEGAPERQLLLCLAECPDHKTHAYGAWCFRKIAPLDPREEDRFHAETAALERAAEWRKHGANVTTISVPSRPKHKI